MISSCTSTVWMPPSSVPYSAVRCTTTNGLTCLRCLMWGTAQRHGGAWCSWGSPETDSCGVRQVDRWVGREVASLFMRGLQL